MSAQLSVSLPISLALRLSLLAVLVWASAERACAQVRLSQIYGAGGNGTAPLLNDYIEIYNSGAPQDLTGWSVQYASSTGSFTSSQVTALPALVLGTGQYLLVQEGTGGTVPAGQVPSLPTAQATGTIAMSSTDFKVALVNSTVALTGSTPTSASIMDLVGAGTATWNEPASTGGGFLSANNSPPASTGHALYRVNCGGSDTNDNNSDWAVGFPSPRNTSTPVNGGITLIGTSLPMTAEELQSLHLTCTPFRCGTLDLGAGTVITVDLTGIGGGAAVAMVDDGTSGDDLAGDGIYTVDAVIAAATATGTKNLPVSASDGGGNTGGTYINVVVTPTTAPDNDNCAGAIGLAVPSSTMGTFTGATVESNPFVTFSSSPTSGMSARRGLWYTVTGTGNTMTASLCATAPALDSVIAVLCGTCDGFTVVRTGDDSGPACTGTAASAAWCSVLGQTYYIWIAPFSTSASTAAYTLDISDDGLVCAGAVACTTCTGVAGPYTETEPGYGRHANDGCVSTPNLFTDIATPGYPGSTFRGVARGMIGNRDVDVYRFQATTSDSITITINTLGTNAQAQFQSLSAGGVCPATTVTSTPLFVARCVSGIQTLTNTVTAGNWYAIQVVGGVGVQAGPTAGTVFGGQMPGGGTYQYELSVTIGGPPANDNCTSAATLAVTGATVNGSTNLATIDGTASCDAVGADVWYSITTTSAGTLRVETCGSAIDTAIALFDSCGGTELACNDDCSGCVCGGTASCISMPGLAAGSYRLRVSDKGTSGAFQVRAVLDVLGNDIVDNATTITCPSMTSATTVGSSLDAGLTVCNGPGVADAGGNTSITAGGIWYRVVGTGDTMYADTITASYDSKLSVYQGPCNALTCVTMNDDIQSSFHSKVAWQTTLGTEYFVLVHGFGTATGTFTLNLTCDPTPSNDNCATATVLSSANGSMGGTNVGATGEPSTITSDVLATCAPDFTYWDTWFSYTAPCTDTLTIRTCGTFDTVVSVHSLCPTLSAGNMIAGACNDDGPVGCTPGSEISLPVTLGTTYLIRVATEGSLGDDPGGGAAYTISWGLTDTDGDLTPDCLDGCPLDPAKIAPGICGCGVSDVDTDGDGTPDCNDLCPLDPLKTAPGICGCGFSDTLDSDGDGTIDCLDGCPFDPLKTAPGICGCGFSDTLDSDGDGTIDCLDGCPFDPLKTAPGFCGCGNPETDSDGDGTPDCVDGCPADPLKIAPGQCGCGNPDTDSDGDGTADCVDGCPADPLKTSPGQCGCGVADTDTDSDGIADCNDNCDTIANPGQEDCDLDGEGDVCELANGNASDLNSNGIPDNCEPGAIISYCTSGTSVNGCSPALATLGTPSASQPNGFYIVTTQNDGQRFGQFFYGISGPQATPFAAGFMCVNAPRQRMGQPFLTGGNVGLCNGAMFIDVNTFATAHPGALGVPLATGLSYYFQGYNRDSGSPGTMVMSNAAAVTFLP